MRRAIVHAMLIARQKTQRGIERGSVHGGGRVAAGYQIGGMQTRLELLCLTASRSLRTAAPVPQQTWDGLDLEAGSA